MDSPTHFNKVFIGGAPRSGTTLLASMIGSHSRVLATPETQFKFDLDAVIQSPGAKREDIIQQLEQHKRFRIWNFKPDFSNVSVNDVSTLMDNLVTLYAASVGKPSFDVWIDSTPVNLRHASFLQRKFPDAKFIHLVRDGRAVYASQRNLDWGSKDPIFAALKWMEALCPGLLAESKYKLKCIRVHFEDLANNPVFECTRICDFIGIPFEKTMLSGKDYKLPAYTRTQHQLVGTKPDTTRIDGWKQSLTAKEVMYFESMTYDVLDMLGYERINKGILKKPNEITQAAIMAKGALKYMTINKWKNRQRFKKNT